VPRLLDWLLIRWAVAMGDSCEWKSKPADLRVDEKVCRACRESKAPIGSLSQLGAIRSRDGVALRGESP
jgi:hypothetical protein